MNLDPIFKKHKNQPLYLAPIVDHQILETDCDESSCLDNLVKNYLVSKQADFSYNDEAITS